MSTRDCAVQTSGSRLTLFINDGADEPTDTAAGAHVCDHIGGDTAVPCGCNQSDHNSMSLSFGPTCDPHLPPKSSAARRHFAKYEPQQLQEMSDEIELGWDCGIWCVYPLNVLACVSVL